MDGIRKKKTQINATVSPYIKQRCVEISETADFASLSDVVSVALSEFIGKYDERENVRKKQRKSGRLENKYVTFDHIKTFTTIHEK
jgi:two-component system, sensor histidine kinase PdtaS